MCLILIMHCYEEYDYYCSKKKSRRLDENADEKKEKAGRGER